jgi:Uncharacterized conserved protein, contains double-stranded beta-helix domain
MSDKPYTYFENLVAEATIPARGIHSLTLSRSGGVELVLFAFAPGEELAEHTAARPAVIHVLAGQADITLGEDRLEAHPGWWVRMPARLPHAIHARTPLVMALYLLPEQALTGEDGSESGSVASV